jgi:hypothetical protein
MFKNVLALFVLSILCFGFLSGCYAGGASGGVSGADIKVSDALQAALDKKYNENQHSPDNLKSSDAMNGGSKGYIVDWRYYQWRQTEGYDHDSKFKAIVYVKLDNTWFEYYTIPDASGNYYWAYYTVPFHSIVEGIKIVYSFHQDGYLCNAHKDWSYTLTCETMVPAYPDTPNIATTAKTKYKLYGALVWWWYWPEGADFNWIKY